jgi:hypothetical protein
MTIADKIRHDAANEIRVYLEGMFWVAYEQSAFWFHLQKGYHPLKWYEECIGQDVVSVRFPVGCFIKGVGYKGFITFCDYQIVLLENDIDTEEFIKWKNTVRLSQNLNF